MKRLTALAIALSTAVVACAVPSAYLFSGRMSGSLGASNFESAEFLIKVTSDTTLLVLNAFGDPALPVDSPSTIWIAGVGTATFSDSANCSVFYNQGNSIVGFGKFNGSDYLDVQTALGPTYDLASSVGPITGTALSVVGFQNVSTNMGELDVIASSVPEATFQAVVPEPSSLMCAGLGVALLLHSKRR